MVCLWDLLVFGPEALESRTRGTKISDQRHENLGPEARESRTRGTRISVRNAARFPQEDLKVFFFHKRRLAIWWRLNKNTQGWRFFGSRNRFLPRQNLSDLFYDFLDGLSEYAFKNSVRCLTTEWQRKTSKHSIFSDLSLGSHESVWGGGSEGHIWDSAYAD